jgi:hypothetical protein
MPGTLEKRKEQRTNAYLFSQALYRKERKNIDACPLLRRPQTQEKKAPMPIAYSRTLEKRKEQGTNAYPLFQAPQRKEKNKAPMPPASSRRSTERKKKYQCLSSVQVALSRRKEGANAYPSFQAA